MQDAGTSAKARRRLETKVACDGPPSSETQVSCKSRPRALHKLKVHACRPKTLLHRTRYLVFVRRIYHSQSTIAASFPESADSLRPKISIQLPSLAIGLQRLSCPFETRRRDLGKHPANRRAVGHGSDLHDVFALPSPDQLATCARGWIHPRHAPRLECGVPYAQRCSVAVA